MPEDEWYWTRTSNSGHQLIQSNGYLGRRIVMCVMGGFTMEEEEEWLAYDPDLVAPTYASFPTLREAKTYCEVTAKLCGS